MASPSDPPGAAVKIPVWLVVLLVTVMVTTIGGGMRISNQFGEASAEMRGSVDRISAIESRLNVLAETQGRLSVVEAKIEADRQRLDRLEARDDRLASGASQSSAQRQ